MPKFTGTVGLKPNGMESPSARYRVSLIALFGFCASVILADPNKARAKVTIDNFTTDKTRI